GQLWTAGPHRILCGDSTDVANVDRLMDGRKAGMIFTDPPYGVNFQSGMSQRFDKLLNDDTFLDIAPVIDAALQDDSAAFVWTAHQVYPVWREQLSRWYRHTLVWHKPGGGMGDLEGNYATNYELCLFLAKGRPTFRGKRGMAVWTVHKDSAGDYLHPTQKPVELAERAIVDFTDPRDIVLDLFVGSGSTIAAAQRLSRGGYGMELDPKYTAVTLQRLADAGLTPELQDA